MLRWWMPLVPLAQMLLPLGGSDPARPHRTVSRRGLSILVVVRLGARYSADPPSRPRPGRTGKEVTEFILEAPPNQHYWDWEAEPGEMGPRLGRLTAPWAVRSFPYPHGGGLLILFRSSRSHRMAAARRLGRWSSAGVLSCWVLPRALMFQNKVHPRASQV